MKTQMNTIRYKRGETIANHTEIHKLMRLLWKNICHQSKKKIDNMEEMDDSLES